MFSVFNTSNTPGAVGSRRTWGAVWGSVPYSRVSPQSWYWRWRGHSLFTPPTDNFCRSRDSNPQPRVTSPMLYPLGHDCPTASHLNDTSSLNLNENLSVFRFPHRSVVLRSSTDQINPTTWHWPPDWWSAGGSKRSKVAVAPSCMGRYLRRPNGWGELTRPNFP